MSWPVLTVRCPGSGNRTWPPVWRAHSNRAATVPNASRTHDAESVTNSERERLKHRLIDVVREAFDTMEPAGIGVGVGHSPVGVNRRELRVTRDGRTSIVLGQEVLHIYRGIRQTVPVDEIAAGFVTLELPTKPREEGSGSRPATAPFNLTVARLGGDVGFVGLGGEVLTEIGMAIKAGSPCRHTFVVTHCNGAAGYLAPKEAHIQEGYEVRTSPFAPQAAEIVVRESIRLLHALRSPP